MINLSYQKTAKYVWYIQRYHMPLHSLDRILSKTLPKTTNFKTSHSAVLPCERRYFSSLRISDLQTVRLWPVGNTDGPRVWCRIGRGNFGHRDNLGHHRFSCCLYIFTARCQYYWLPQLIFCWNQQNICHVSFFLQTLSSGKVWCSVG